MNKKQLIALTMSAVMALSLAACGSEKPAASSQSSSSAVSEDSGSTVQIPNPWTEYTDLAEAVQASGIPLSVPDAVEGYPQRFIQALTGEDATLEVRYLNDDGQEICIRKTDGAMDPSGDYNTYEQESSSAVGDRTVTLKGNSDQVSLAVWAENGYHYSIGAYDDSGTISGISSEEMLALVNEVA